MISIKSTGQEKDAWKGDREPLFTIDDQEYTVPKKVPANVGLRAVDTVARLGEADGTRWLMVLMLGEDGWKALMDCDGLEPADLQAIQEVLRAKVFGDLEAEGKG
jgi:hypothetical protein